MRRVIVGTFLGTAALAMCVHAAPPPNSVEGILANARQALGGEQRLLAVTSFELKGDVVSMQSVTRVDSRPEVGTFDIACDLPEKFVRTESHAESTAGDMISGEDFIRLGSSHFVTRLGFDHDRVIHERSYIGGNLPPGFAPPTQAELKQWLPDAQENFLQVTLGLFARSFLTVPVQFLETRGTQDGTAVEVRGNVSVIMRFDPHTHLPASLGTLQYTDYRDVDGFKVPFKIGRMVNVRDGKSMRAQFQGLEVKTARFTSAPAAHGAK